MPPSSILLHHGPIGATSSAARRVHRTRTSSIDSEGNISAVRKQVLLCSAAAPRLSRTRGGGCARKEKKKTHKKTPNKQLFINIKAPLTTVRAAANAPFAHDTPVKKAMFCKIKNKKKNPNPPARLRTLGLLCNIRGKCRLTYILPPARRRSGRCQRWTSSWAVAVLVAEAFPPLFLPLESTPGLCRRNATEAGASLGRCAPSVRRWCAGLVCGSPGGRAGMDGWMDAGYCWSCCCRRCCTKLLMWGRRMRGGGGGWREGEDERERGGGWERERDLHRLDMAVEGTPTQMFHGAA